MERPSSCLLPFLYSAKLNKTQLSQGDLLERNVDLVAAIGAAHQYYAEAEDYTHFVIITQSCDLVKRPKFKAPYITIAAAKPLKSVLDRELKGKISRLGDSDVEYISNKTENEIKQKIQKLLNNTDSEHFFFPRNTDIGLTTDLVAFLRLTIALRREHYDVLAGAKIAELEEVFRAKLGWLTGSIYSRVATPDLSDEGLDEKKVRSIIEDEFINRYLVLPPDVAKFYGKITKEQSARLGKILSSDEVRDVIMAQQITSLDLRVQDVTDRLRRDGLLTDGPDVDELVQNILKNKFG